MTGKQKALIAALAVADLAVVLGLALVMLNSRPVTPEPPPALPPTCRWEAARLLAQAGVGGTTATTGGMLRFDLAVPLAPRVEITTGVEQAAQTVWTAFDVALALHGREECAAFEGVSVAVAVVDGGRTVGHIAAQVPTAALLAFDRGTLSEEDFIGLVTYSAAVTP